MTDDTEGLILPDTMEETRDAISVLIGDVTEAREWVKLQHEGRKSGQRINWRAVEARQAEIATLQGDIDALKKHLSGFRADLALKQSEQSLEKRRLKAANLAKQQEIQAQARAAKKDKTILTAQRHARGKEAALKAVLAYIAEVAPEHLPAARAVANAAEKATA